MKFGISTAPQNIGWSEIRDVWVRADALEFDSGWIFDHILAISGNIEDPILEVWTLLAALADATSQIRLGSLVTCNTLRHPALLAKMTATIDHISNGRVILGIGAGYFEPEHELFGIPLPSTRERSEMLEESVQIVRGLWSEGRFSFAGEHYEITDAPLEPLPVQPTIPILMGGGGEKRTLRVVAEHADLWNMPPGGIGITPESYGQKYGVLLDWCEKVGRDPSEIEPHLAFPVFVDEQESKALERKRRLAESMGMDEPLASRHILAGTPEQVTERLREFEEAGVRHFVMGVRPWLVEGDLELFAEQVVKPWRADDRKRGMEQ